MKTVFLDTIGILALIDRHGWRLARIKGSYHFYIHPDRAGIPLVVPVHGNRDLKQGLYRSLLKLAGLPESDV